MKHRAHSINSEASDAKSSQLQQALGELTKQLPVSHLVSLATKTL